MKNGLDSNQLRIMDLVSKRILEPTTLDSRASFSNYSDFKLLLDDLKNKSTRECQKKINSFMVSFEENLQNLTELANLVEFKNEVKLRKIGGEIMKEIEKLEKEKSNIKKTEETKKEFNNRNEKKKNYINAHSIKRISKEKEDVKDVKLSSKVQKSSIVLNDLLRQLKDLVQESFKSIEKKISKYEEISRKKIYSIQNSFGANMSFINV